MTYTNKHERKVRRGLSGLNSRERVPQPSSPQPSSPRPPAPGPQSPAPRAFTLIELLIVISIMVILLSLVATMAPLDREGRRVREAARSINGYLSSARNRAIETGRPCGVIFRNFGTGAAMNADQCEVPPSYAGECTDSIASVVASSPTTIQATLITVTAPGTAEPIPIGMVRQGDLIQFNHQGPLYTITNDPSGGGVNVLTLVMDATHNGNQLVPWTTTAKFVPYRIFRSPIKGYAPPLQMPVPAVVDLTASGVGGATPTDFIGTTIGSPNLTIMFSSTGAVECIYVETTVAPFTRTRYVAGDTIYLLVGSNERVANPYIQDNPNVDTLTNYQDMNNIWVTINPQTGAVQTEPVAQVEGMGISDPATAINAARALAVEGVGMGGK